MALTEIDKIYMTDADEALIQAITNQWEKARVANDLKAQEAAHNAAEAIRAKYNYSGGGWGNEFIAINDQVQKESYESAPSGNALQADPYYTANQGTVDTPNGNYTGLIDLPANVTRVALYGALALGGIFLLKAFTK